MSCQVVGAAPAPPPSIGAMTVVSNDLAALPLESLLDMEVTGASKFAQRASESAASVTVVSAAEIRALGYRTLAEVLSSVRGLDVVSDRNYSYLGVRGFAAQGDYNTRVLLLIDGNRVNDPVYGQAFVGAEFPLDIDLVERVEFIPGQGSSLYGANALFGVINVITRQVAGDAQRSALAAGSGDSREGRVELSRSFASGGQLRLALSRQVARGRHIGSNEGVDDGPGAIGITDLRDADYERRSAVYLSAGQGPLAFTLIHADRLKGNPLGLDMAPGDPRNFNRDSHLLMDATLRHGLGSAGEMTARAFVGRYRFDGQYAYADPEVPLNRDVSIGRWWGAEARLLTTRWDDHKAIFGVEYQRDSELRQTNQDVGRLGAVHLDDRRSGQRAAFYVENQFAFAARWVLTAGARYDVDDQGLRRLSPRLALNYRPREDLVLKLIHGSAYRQANAYEAHYAVDSPAGYKTNPALWPETVRGNEFTAEWRPDATTRFSGSVYVNRARRLLALDYDADDDRYVFRNARAVRTGGLELEFERVWQSGARLRANLALQTARDGGDLDIARYTPRRMGKVVAILPLQDDWLIGTQWHAVSARAAARGHGRLDATLSRYFGHQGTTLSLSLCNLLDRRYDDPGADLLRQPTIAQPGRSWRLRLDLVF